MKRVRNTIKTVFHGSVNLLLLLFSVTCIFPVLWVLNSSLRTNGEFLANSFCFPEKLHWENYDKAINNMNLGVNFRNSSYLTAISLFFIIVFALGVGYFLARYDFPGKKAVYGMFLSGLIVPTIALMIPVFMMFNKVGMLNHWYTLLFLYVAFNMPLSIILIENFIHTIPKEMDESAKIDGASRIQLIARIILPLTKPMIATLVILNMMNIWNEFPFALILLRSPELMPISVGLSSFKSMYSFDYTLYMAGIIVAILPVIIVYIIGSRQIIESMTIGAVKG